MNAACPSHQQKTVLINLQKALFLNIQTYLLNYYTEPNTEVKPCSTERQLNTFIPSSKSEKNTAMRTCSSFIEWQSLGIALFL